MPILTPARLGNLCASKNSVPFRVRLFRPGQRLSRSQLLHLDCMPLLQLPGLLQVPLLHLLLHVATVVPLLRLLTLSFLFLLELQVLLVCLSISCCCSFRYFASSSASLLLGGVTWCGWSLLARVGGPSCGTGFSPGWPLSAPGWRALRLGMLGGT